jgi:hypothetical protein
MDPVRIAVFVAAIPAATAAAVLLFLRRLRRGAEAPADAGLAITAGFAAGFLCLDAWPLWPPSDPWKWLLPVAVAGGAIGVLPSSFPRAAEAVRWARTAVLAAFVTWVAVLDRTAPWLGGAFAATMAVVWGLDVVARRAGGATFLGTVVVLAASVAVSSERSYFATLALVGGVLAAAAGGCLVLAWFAPTAVRGAAALCGILVAAMTLNCLVYADLPPVSAGLLAAASPAAGVAAALTASLPGRRRAAIVVGVAALVAGAAAVVAIQRAAGAGE